MPVPLDSSQIVVLSSIDWEAAWQRHQIFATQLAEAGHEVFFVENSGFRNPGVKDLPRVWKRLKKILRPEAAAGRRPKTAGVEVIAPRLLPPTHGAFRLANASLFIPQLLEKLKKSGLKPQPIVIVYFATETTLELIRRLEPALVIYDCAANFRAHPLAPKNFAALETRLLEAADLVVCDSDFLYKQKQGEHDRVVQIHQGVSEDFFKAAPPKGHWRSFCYYGTWSRDLNPDFLTALSGAGFEVGLSVFLKGSPPPLPSSIKMMSAVPPDDLPARLEKYESMILPYRINPFLMGVVPAKIYECLALGRPILATPLPALKAFGDLIYTAETPRDWVRIAQALPKTETPRLREKRMALAREHTHAKEFERLLREIKKI